jgi:hypothetical protein
MRFRIKRSNGLRRITSSIASGRNYSAGATKGKQEWRPMLT